MHLWRGGVREGVEAGARSGRTATPKSSRAKSNRTSPLWRAAGVPHEQGGLRATLKAGSEDAPQPPSKIPGVCAQVFQRRPTLSYNFIKRGNIICQEVRVFCYYYYYFTFGYFFWTYQPMWLLGSTTQVMMMDERMSPSARCVQNPGSNPSTVHSIEAILGFKEDTIFHKSASYNVMERVQVKDAERNGNGIVSQTKKNHYSESCDSK